MAGVLTFNFGGGFFNTPEERRKSFRNEMSALNGALDILNAAVHGADAAKAAEEFSRLSPAAEITDDIYNIISIALICAFENEDMAAAKEISELLEKLDGRPPVRSKMCSACFVHYLIWCLLRGEYNDFAKDAVNMIVPRLPFVFNRDIFGLIILCAAASEEEILNDILCIFRDNKASMTGYALSVCIYAAIYLENYRAAEQIAEAGGTVAARELKKLIFLRSKYSGGDESERKRGEAIDRILRNNTCAVSAEAIKSCYPEMTDIMSEFPDEAVFPPHFHIDRIDDCDSLWEYVNAVEKDSHAREVFAGTLTIGCIPMEVREISRKLAQLLPDTKIVFDVTEYDFFYHSCGDIKYLIEKCNIIFDRENIDRFGKVIIDLDSTPVAAAAVKKGIINEKNIDGYIEYASEKKCLKALKGITNAV